MRKFEKYTTDIRGKCNRKFRENWHILNKPGLIKIFLKFPIIYARNFQNFNLSFFNILLSIQRKFHENPWDLWKFFFKFYWMFFI